MWINIAAVCAGAYLISWIALWAYRWGSPRCSSGKLPPGSMGLPLLGETFQFFTPSTNLEVSPFVQERVKRYGPIFKTSLVGQPAVMITDPELSRIIFQQEGRLLQVRYPYTFRKVMGRQNMGEMQGVMHKYLKSLVLRLLGPETLKGKLIHDVGDAACRSLSSWAEQPAVELKEATATLLFNLTAKKLISYDPSESSEDLKENFSAFIKGLISFPINLPGTAYSKCMQGRKRAMRVLRRMLKERRQSSQGRHDREEDFFDLVIEELEKERGTILTEDIALDLVFLLLFASFETTSLTLTMAIKFLSDHPQVLKELTKEHEDIINRRKDPSSKVTWQEYRSMTFTSQVINETLRLANIAPVMFRKAIDDIQINGYTIPAGWSVIVCPPAVHLNPDIYEDPLAFNPWRWENNEKSNGVASKYFMAFGGGVWLCVGADFSKMQMAIFLHYLVTKYRWRVVKDGKIIRNPGLSFPDGFEIQIMTERH